jgi:hypothetical protein
MTTHQPMRIGRKATTPPSFTFARTGLLQRKCACGGTPHPADEREVRGTQSSDLRTQHRFLVPPIVHEVLGSPGQPLDTVTRSVMEPRFDHDFSQVRVHPDTQAAKSARAVNALAYTVGKQIVFGLGQYAPNSREGQYLIAHELTHTLQQGTATPRENLWPDRRGDACERQAEDVAANFTRLKALLPFPILSATPALQRFESFEHVQLGERAGGPGSGLILLDCYSRDLPQHAKPANTCSADWQAYYGTLDFEQRRALTSGLTYGEIVALSGDMFDSFQSLNRAPLREIIDLVPRIRSRSTTTEQFQAATGGRYLALAKENIGHFSNVPVGQRNRDIWRRNHIDAITAARSGNSDVAWGLNAAGDHFLTDAFSGGHLRVDRAVLHAQGTVGDIQSKILHDLDNRFGVEVTNERGDPPWIAYGDEHLNDPANARSLSLALEAVELSKKDIADALSQRTGYPMPTATTVFAAERLIPKPVSLTGDRWTGRQSNPLIPGNPFTSQTDYQRERRKLIAGEAPGVVSELTQDDDRVRAWINRMDVGALGRQSESDKVRMINVLLSGVVDATDMDAIVRLLGSVADATEMGHLRSIFEPRATSLHDIGLRTRLRLALARTP